MGCFAILRFFTASITIFCLSIVLSVYWDLPNDGPKIKTPFDRQLVLHNGRNLSYADYGSPTGDVILYLHGTPGSRIYPWGDSPLLQQKNIRVISFDRPGFGQSTRNPQLSLTSVVSDIGELMDHLNITRFSILGISGGAPYVYASLYTMPQKINSALIISGTGPIAEIGKCPEMMELLFNLYNISLPLYRGMIWFMRQSIYYIHAFGFDEKFLEMAKDSLVPSDAKALEDPKLAKWSNRATVEGLRQGSSALAVESAMFWTEWNFSIANIDTPLTVWHGDKDKNAPLSHSKYACEKIAKAKCVIFENEGHLLFWSRESEIYDELLKYKN